ncbi:MAG: hypothetical protein FWE27_06395 [Defluviitaleaceae bacterium]|nr:hypothetical protein [Defluviitaleaceae bacterium]
MYRWILKFVYGLIKNSVFLSVIAVSAITALGVITSLQANNLKNSFISLATVLIIWLIITAVIYIIFLFLIKVLMLDVFAEYGEGIGGVGWVLLAFNTLFIYWDNRNSYGVWTCIIFALVCIILYTIFDALPDLIGLIIHEKGYYPGKISESKKERIMKRSIRKTERVLFDNATTTRNIINNYNAERGSYSKRMQLRYDKIVQRRKQRVNLARMKGRRNVPD